MTELIEVTHDSLTVFASKEARKVRLHLAVTSTPFGPLLQSPAARSGPRDPWGSLTTVVNRLLLEDPAVSEALLRQGEDVAWYDAAVWHPRYEPVPDAARAAWEGFEGADTLLEGELVVLEDAIAYRQMVFSKARLLAIVDALRAARASVTPPPIPWLFRVDPYDFGGPGDGEEALLGALEARAAALDAHDAPAAAAERSSQRRFLLGDLEAAGIFDSAHRGTKAAYLEQWGLHTLLGYLRAAEALEAYAVSEDRQRVLPEAPKPDPQHGPISVDWFRCGAPTPAGWTPHDWLAVCEFWFVQSGLTEESTSDDELFVRLDGGTYRFDWRRDDGLSPALVSVHPAS